MVDETTTDVSSGGPGRRRDDGLYLLVFDDSTSWKHALPNEGTVLIGRSEEAHIRLHDRSVSRRHAQLTIHQGYVKVIDLDSHNGVLVNGHVVRREAPLHSHDLLALGKAMLVLHSEASVDRASAVSFDELMAQGEKWIRQRNRMGRLAVVLVEFASPPALPKVLANRLAQRGAASWASPCELVALVPGPASDDRVAMADLMVDALDTSVPVRASCATSPADGTTVRELLTRVRSALAKSERTTGGSIHRVRVNDRTVLVADPAMLRLHALLGRLAASDVPVLIGGETGVGKEVAAQVVHFHSKRAQRPFVTLNCASLPETLAESQLFGHDKGAFTGAVAAKPGLFESAAGGTVFLDEIGELSQAIQAKLLRVVETKKSMRLGDLRERDIDMRILAATNQDLEAEVTAGRFRSDLYFRLSVATVWIPPLRDRPRELAVLAQEFLSEACARAGRETLSLSAATCELFATYGWPGNVRELRNVIELAVASVPGPVVEPSDLPKRVRGALAGGRTEPGEALAVHAAEASARADRRSSPLDEEIRDLERRRMIEALAACDGNQSRAAELIGMPRGTFVAKLKQHGIRRGGSE